jgi:hypothetical protein
LPKAPRTTFELPAGAAFGERSADMQQWMARRSSIDLGVPGEDYAVGDVLQFPTPDGKGSLPARFWISGGTPRVRRCYSISITRWPGKR